MCIKLLLSRRSILPSLGCASLLPSGFALAAPPDLTMEAFRDEVIMVGKRRMPDMAVRAGRAVQEVISGDHFLYLGNIFATAREMPASAREELIVAWLSHFSPAADAKTAAIKAATDDWTRAAPLLRPKLIAPMRPAIMDRLVSHSFVAGLTIIYAIDMGDTDLYVLKDKAAKWKTPPDEIRAEAIANLENMSSGICNGPRDSKGAMINVTTRDGYDAARLILPGLRKRLLGVLGDPYRAAVPTRDMLMLWSKGDDAFEARMASLVRDNAAGGDHPVSPTVFACDAGGVHAA